MNGLLLAFLKNLSGIRIQAKGLEKTGKKIKPQSIANYESVLKLLADFETSENCTLVIRSINTNNQKLLQKEQKYWNKFFRAFTNYLFIQKSCHDNYVGHVIKIIRIFFGYLAADKFLPVGNFYKKFYVYKEEIPVVILFPDQLKFLIHDQSFEAGVSNALKRTRDIFILGCTVGLRFSDLFWGTEHSNNKHAVAYEGLGKLYVSDDRFTMMDGKLQPGYALFLSKAMTHYAKMNLR